MRAYCKKCKKIVEFRERLLMVKSGDRGYSQDTVYTCSVCGFSPFFLPEVQDGSDKRSE